MCNDPVYMLFAGDHYYPCGGMNDFQEYFRSVDEAVEATVGKKYDWWHIVDNSNMKTVRRK